MPLLEAQTALDELGLAVKVFDEELASLRAFLRLRGHAAIGASLGDRVIAWRSWQCRACRRGTPVVYTPTLRGPRSSGRSRS